MRGKPQAFSDCSRSSSRDKNNPSRQRTPNRTSSLKFTNKNTYRKPVTLIEQLYWALYNPDHEIFKIANEQIIITIIALFQDNI